MENKKPEIIVFSEGFLHFEGDILRCALGKNGIKENKREGDGATPAGTFKLREVWYRQDRLPNLRTGLPKKEITNSDGWSDDVKSLNYNRHIKLPTPEHTEKLWREDNLYDAVIVIGYNDEPVQVGAGSCIFMHLAKPNYSPTEGCIALDLSDLLNILEHSNENTQIKINPLVPLVPPPQTQNFTVAETPTR